MDLEQMKARLETLEADKATSEAQFAALQRQTQLFAQRETLADRWSALRTKAALLLEQGKLTPASFKAKFEGKNAPAIAQFGATQLDEAETAITGFEKDCDRLEYLLEDLEQNGVPVRFGLPVEGKDIDPATEKEQAAKEADQFLDSYALPRSY